jgi:hypothetical protein
MSMLIKKIMTSVTWATAMLPRQCSSVFSLRNSLLACLAWLFALSLTFSCDKLPRNGKLDGHWQLMERDGSSVQAERTYWAIQLDLLQLRSFTKSPITKVKYSGGVVARFSHQGDSLIITKGYLMNRVNQQDILIDSKHQADLSAFGITELPMRYKVELLTDEKMTLVSGTHRLVLRKF